MKKQTKIIIWSVVAVLLVVGCVLGLKFVSDKKNEQMAGPVELFECLPDNIIGYSVDNGKGQEYELIKASGVWMLENKPASIDNKKVEELIRCATKITATGIATGKEEPGKVSDIRKVKIGLDNGKSFEMTFLSENAGICTFTVTGDDTMYTMYTATRDILTVPFEKLRRLELFAEFDDVDNPPDFYEFTDYDKSELSIRLKNGHELAQDDKNRYMMTKPYYRSVDDEKFIQQIVVNLPNVKRDGDIAKVYTASLEDYGLDAESRATLKMGIKDKQTVLYLGKTDNGLVYAQFEGKSEVFTIVSSQLEFLNTEAFYLIDSRLIESDFGAVDKISVSTADGVYELDRNVLKDGSEWFSINGNNANKEIFDEIIGMVNEIELVSELVTVPENTKDILISIKCDDHKKNVDIALVPAGEKTYAVFVGNEAKFAVEKQKIDEIIEKLKK